MTQVSTCLMPGNAVTLRCGKPGVNLVTSPLPGEISAGDIPEHHGLVHGAGHQLGVVTGALAVQHLHINQYL